MSSILCPHCKKSIAIEEALSHQVEEKVRESNEKFLAEQKARITKEAQDESEKKTKILQEEIRIKEAKLKEAQDAELIVRKEKLNLEEERRSFELQKQRQIDEERQKIREQTTKEILESQKFKELEKDKIISDLKHSLEEAQRKATQSSQQLQGEVQELDLEETLKSSFITDIIEPVGKGVRGADLSQTVKTPHGNVCGTILWECKRTKAWSDEWVIKLKEDIRSSKANLAVIVSTILPKEINGIGCYDGIWVTTYSLVVPLSELLRSKLIEVARERFLAQNKGGKAEDVYAYVTGHEFKQQVEAMVEVYQSMQEQLLKEKVAFEKIWKVREAQITRILSSTASIVGSIQGTSGSNLPIKGLDLLES